MKPWDYVNTACAKYFLNCYVHSCYKKTFYQLDSYYEFESFNNMNLEDCDQGIEHKPLELANGNHLFHTPLPLPQSCKQ